MLKLSMVWACKVPAAHRAKTKLKKRDLKLITAPLLRNNNRVAAPPNTNPKKQHLYPALNSFRRGFPIINIAHSDKKRLLS